MRQELSEVAKLQKIAGILNEAAPPMPPLPPKTPAVPGQKPPMPPVPGQKPAAPAANTRPLDDKKKEQATEAFFQANLQLTTLQNHKLLSDPDIRTLEHLLQKAIAAIGDHK